MLQEFHDVSLYCRDDEWIWIDIYIIIPNEQMMYDKHTAVQSDMNFVGVSKKTDSKVTE